MSHQGEDLRAVDSDGRERGGTSRRGFLVGAAGVAGVIGGATLLRGAEPAAAAPGTFPPPSPPPEGVDPRIGRLLKIGTATVGTVTSVAGGGITADVVNTARATGEPFERKSLGGAAYDHLFLTVGLFSSTSALWPWVRRALDGAGTQTFTMLTVDSRNTIVSKADITGVLSRVDFPANNGSDSNPATIGLRISPSRIVVGAASGTGPPASALPTWLKSNFRLTISDIPTMRVSRVEAFSVSTPLTNEGRTTQAISGAPLVPNLRVWVSAADQAAWIRWHEDFVVRRLAVEKTGSLSYMSTDLATTFARVDFTGLGPLRLTRVVPPGGSISQIVADLYCERIVFTRL